MTMSPPQPLQLVRNRLVPSVDSDDLSLSPSKPLESTSSAFPMPAEFNRFPKLAAEIRLQIWELAASIPRDLAIWTRHSNIQGSYGFKFATTSPVPSILHTNKESRTVGLKYYQLAFGTNLIWGHITRVVVLPPRIYLNTRADRVCFFGRNIGESAEYISIMIEEYKVTRLAVNVAGRGQCKDPWTREMLCLVDIELQTYPSAWLNARIEEITLFYRPQEIDFGVQVSFKEFGEDYEQAIRGQKDTAQIHDLANMSIVRKGGLELCLAKDNLAQSREQCLKDLDSALAEAKQDEEEEEGHVGNCGKAKSEIQDKNDTPDGVDGTLYCAWVGGREKSLIVKLAKMSILHR